MGVRQRYGQHFLVDDDVLDRMIRLAEIRPDDTVFEIGSGTGKLTDRLCEKAEQVISIEIDGFLYREAKKRLVERENLTLENGDAFRSTVKQFDILVSSLPYSESTRFIEWLIVRSFRRAVVLVQSEFGEKLLSPPKSPNYRGMSAIAQSCLVIRKIENVSRNAFTPPPTVTSTMLVIIPKERPEIEDLMMIKMIFSFRGRKLSAALKSISKHNQIKLNDLIDRCGRDNLGKRVSELEPQEALVLAKVINSFH